MKLETVTSEKSQRIQIYWRILWDQRQRYTCNFPGEEKTETLCWGNSTKPFKNIWSDFTGDFIHTLTTIRIKVNLHNASKLLAT